MRKELKMTIRQTRLPLLAAFAAMLASACVTQPEPCTAEWVEWKTDQVLDRYADEYRGTIRDLRGVSGDIENPSVLTALRIATLAGDAETLVRDFNTNVLPEINDAIALCGQPRQFVPACTSVLRREGVGEDVIDWIEAFGVYFEIQQRT